MQSLVLATSLLLSSQSPVIAKDVAQEVERFVQNETSRVTQLVHYREQAALKDVLLQPAKLVAKQKTADKQSLTLAAE